MNLKEISQKLLKIIIIILIIAIVFYLAFNISIYNNYSSRIYTKVSDVPNVKVALVLGAGLDILHDRVDAASELYNQGKVQKLLMSGDNRFTDYNEPELMTKYAKSDGVRNEDIYQDYAGLRTYDSCYRAKNIFQLDEVIIVTQSWHLPRAMYICEQLGLKVWGYSSDPGSDGVRTYRQYNVFEWNYWKFRDSVSLVQSFFEINFFPPNNVIGGEKIEIK